MRGRTRRGAVVFVSCAGVLFGVASSGVAGAAVVHAPRQFASATRHGAGGVHSTWAASNWSGYAETGVFTGVTGTWTVPSVSATPTASYSSSWIGVDGFNNSDLIQTGTEQDYYRGAAHYYAWWEILPASETEITATADRVLPGDRMQASIYETSTTVSRGGRRSSTERLWTIVISDSTRGWSFTTSQPYSGPGTSAEWVTEAPEVNGSIATLAHYSVNPPAGTGDFDNAGTLATAVANGHPAYSAAALNYQNDSGVMIQNGVQVSTPGQPDSALSAFDVGYGSSVPATPAG